MKSTLWRLGAVALLVGSGLVMAPATPALAWDVQHKPFVCGQTETLKTPFGADGFYANSKHTSVLIYEYTDAKRLPTDGHSLRHYYATPLDGGLTFKINSRSVEIKAPACPKPPKPPLVPEHHVVPCNLDPEFSWDRTRGQSGQWKWTSDDHTTGELTIFLNSKKLRQPGQAKLFSFSTLAGCHLEREITKTKINVWAEK